MPLTPRAIDPDFAQSLADGLTESYEAYCQRLDTSSPNSDQPTAGQPGGEATP